MGIIKELKIILLLKQTVLTTSRIQRLNCRWKCLGLQLNNSAVHCLRVSVRFLLSSFPFLFFLFNVLAEFPRQYSAEQEERGEEEQDVVEEGEGVPRRVHQHWVHPALHSSGRAFLLHHRTSLKQLISSFLSYQLF